MLSSRDSEESVDIVVLSCAGCDRTSAELDETIFDANQREAHP